jgi:hypothetical protein
MFTFSLANLQHSLALAVCLCLFMLACHIFVNHQKSKDERYPFHWTGKLFNYAAICCTVELNCAA